jgi:glutathione S-transferase
MRLYGTPTSPYVRKIRVLLAEKSIAYDFLPIDLAAPDSPAKRLNPLAKVPVLERSDGEILFDSPVIAEYLDTLKPPALVPSAGEARWQVLRWHALAQGVLDATALQFLERRRPAAQQSTDWLARQESKIVAAIQYADAHAPREGFLVGASLSLADLAMAVALEYVDFRYRDAWRDDYPRLVQWLAPMSARPSMRQTQPPR